MTRISVQQADRRPCKISAFKFDAGFAQRLPVETGLSAENILVRVVLQTAKRFASQSCLIALLHIV
jgi:tryptophanase